MSEKYYVACCVDNGLSAEIVEDEHAEFWTLYARDSEGLSEGIIDCVFREDAEAAMDVYVERDRLKEELSRYSMSPGWADHRQNESKFVRVALGFAADANDVSPKNLVDAITRLNEQVRALAAENATLTSGFSFFMHSPDAGFETYKSREEAVKAANEMIDDYRQDAADEGWPEEVEQTVWGVIIQQATQCEIKKPSEDNRWAGSCDYKLMSETPATDTILREVRARAVDEFAKNIGTPYGEGTGETYQDGFNRAMEVLKKNAVNHVARIRAGEVPNV